MKNPAPNPAWDPRDDARLVALAKQNLSAEEIGRELCRSASAVRNRAQRLRINFGKVRAVSNQRALANASTFGMGDRVRLSALGRERSPQMKDVPGTVVKISNLPSSVAVLFDGRRTPVLMHRAYIERVEPTGK